MDALQKTNSKAPNHRRPRQRERGGGREVGGNFRTTATYRALRRMVLAAEPLCRICAANGFTVAAEELDHIERVVDRPDLAFAVSNFQPLCRPCHEKKTAGERKRIKGATLEGDLL